MCECLLGDGVESLLDPFLVREDETSLCFFGAEVLARHENIMQAIYFSVFLWALGEGHREVKDFAVSLCWLVLALT